MGQIRRPTYTVKVTDPETGKVHTERREGSWQIRWYDGRGKRHELGGFKTHKEAKDELIERERAAKGGAPAAAQLGRLRASEAFANVVRDHEVNERRTTDDVARRIRLHLDPYFGPRKLRTIGPADVRAYSAQRQKDGATNATVNRELAILRRAFRLAHEDGALLRVPRVPMLTEAAPRSGFFERDEFEAVREHLPEYLRGVVTLAYWTGWRIASEVLPLEWRQVDRRRQVVRLEPGTTKNNRGRTLPFGELPALVEVIGAAWQEHERLAGEGTVSPYVFPHQDGRPIRDFRGAWKAACEAAGVPGRLVHDFRRTAARNLVRAGVSQKVAMGITGHLTPSVFNRYDIVVEEDLRQGLGRLAEAAEGKEKGKTASSGKVRPFRGSR